METQSVLIRTRLYWQSPQVLNLKSTTNDNKFFPFCFFTANVQLLVQKFIWITWHIWNNFKDLEVTLFTWTSLMLVRIGEKITCAFLDLNIQCTECKNTLGHEERRQKSHNTLQIKWVVALWWTLTVRPGQIRFTNIKCLKARCRLVQTALHAYTICGIKLFPQYSGCFPSYGAILSVFFCTFCVRWHNNALQVLTR